MMVQDGEILLYIREDVLSKLFYVENDTRSRVSLLI